MTAELSGLLLSPPIYLDASALVKRLVPESESDALNQALVGVEGVVLSDLATETASALGRRTREQRVSRAESRRLYRGAQKLAAACTGARHSRFAWR